MDAGTRGRKNKGARRLLSTADAMPERGKDLAGTKIGSRKVQGRFKNLPAKAKAARSVAVAVRLGAAVNLGFQTSCEGREKLSLGKQHLTLARLSSEMLEFRQGFYLATHPRHKRKILNTIK